MKKKILQSIAKLPATLKTLLKVSVLGRRCHLSQTLRARNGDRRLVVLGNGPSLTDNIANDMEWLKASDTLAVNFAANSPSFGEIRPKYYVLADPHFFEKAETDQNVKILIDNLNKVDWPIMLFVPARAKGVNRLFHNGLMEIRRFNFLAVEGYRWMENLLMNTRMGMPRPRNVLIPSLMLGIWLGYKEIAVLGADHSWLKTLTVNEQNEVVSVQPHFYKEDDREVERIRREYVRLPLHEVIESMMIAFRSYHRIRQYADYKGVCIYNATPDSMIDAFERKKLSVLKSTGD